MTTAASQSLEDLLDLEKNKLSSIPPKRLTASERWMRYLGLPLGILVFLALYYMPNPAGLSMSGQVVIACFALALVWWVTEPIPTYATSLFLILTLVLLDGWGQKAAIGVLGFDVIWLNIMAFVLSSTLVKTNLAKRLALTLITRFGGTSNRIFAAFFLINLLLSAFIPATAAKAAILLPLMLVVAAIYGASNAHPNACGKNLFLQNLQGINVGANAFMTGSNANLIAVAFILSMASERVYYTDWLVASLPVVVVVMVISWYIGPRLVFPMKREETRPRIEGGIDHMRRQLDELGPVSRQEIKSAAVFGLVIFLWISDKAHMAWFGFELSAVMAAMIGAWLVFLPKIGILKWNEADIPWHLMIFSCGAYAGGFALNETGAARWLIGSLFERLDIGAGTDFWLVYAIVIVTNMFASIFFTSKTMRTLIMIPFVITIAQELGFHPLSLALPAAFTINWVIALPINAKPNVILFSTGQYSVLDSLRYGLTMMAIGSALLILAGMTWFRFLGITP